MVLGAMSVAFAMLLSMVNLPASAEEGVSDQPCPAPPGGMWVKQNGAGESTDTYGWVKIADDKKSASWGAAEGYKLTGACMKGSTIKVEFGPDVTSASNDPHLCEDKNVRVCHDISHVVAYFEKEPVVITPDPTLPAPSVTLEKSVSPLTSVGGGDFTFTLTIKNNSDHAVEIKSLTDTNTLPESCISLIGDVIGAKGSTNCDYKINKTEEGTYTNEASVTVKNNEGKEASDIASATYTVTKAQEDPDKPSVTLEKSANPDTLQGGGEFTFTLTITSDQDVSITGLTDSWWGDAGPQGDCSSLTSLEAGIPKSCTYSITESEVGSHTNFASVTVSNSNGGDSANASATIKVTEKQPDPIVLSVDLVKSVNHASLPKTNGKFTFTLDITNTSQYPVTIDELEDTHDLSIECEALVTKKLAVGEKVSCNYDVELSEVKEYLNTASVTVSYEGVTASASDTEAVTVTDIPPDPGPDQLSVTLDKSVSPRTLKGGGVFTFNLLITNTSDETEKIIDLEDDYPLSDECNALVGANIDPGKSVSCTYTLTENKVGDYINEASVTVSEVESMSNSTRTASAKDDAEFSVTGGETTEVPVDPNPSETPDPETTTEPTEKPNPEKTPEPPVVSDEPNPTLAPPTTSSNPTVLIPVTGIEFGTPINKVQSISFNLGLGLLGVSLVLRSIRKKIR